MRNCTGRGVATAVDTAVPAPAAKKRCTGHSVALERLQF